MKHSRAALVLIAALAAALALSGCRRSGRATAAEDAAPERLTPSQVTARAQLATVAVIAEFNVRATVPRLKLDADRLSAAMERDSESGVEALIATFLGDPASCLFRSLSVDHPDSEVLRGFLSRLSNGQSQATTSENERAPFERVGEMPQRRSHLPFLMLGLVGIVLFAIVAIVILSSRR